MSDIYLNSTSQFKKKKKKKWKNNTLNNGGVWDVRSNLLCIRNGLQRTGWLKIWLYSADASRVNVSLLFRATIDY